MGGPSSPPLDHHIKIVARPRTLGEPMNLTTIISSLVAFAAGVVVTLLNQFFVMGREWRANRLRRKSESSFLAMRIAVILEEFTIKCINRNWHDETDLHEGIADLDFKLPPLTPYPQDSPDWKSFHDVDAKLAGRVLAFPNEITSAELASQYAATREGDRTASADKTVIAGLNAWKLARALREKYDLGEVQIANIDSLEHAAEKIEQRRRDFVASIKPRPKKHKSSSPEKA